MSAPKRSLHDEGGLPYGDEDAHGAGERRDKPKDWRSAFLDGADDRREPSRDERSRQSARSDSRDRDGSRHARERSRSRDRPRRDDRDSTRDRRPRSPSPPRHGGGYGRPGRGGGYGAPRGGDYGRGGARGGGRGGSGGRYDHNASARPRNDNPRWSPERPRAVSSSDHRRPASPPPEKEPPKPVKPEIIEEIPDTEALSPEELLAERRRKRQEILEKFSGLQSANTSVPGSPTVAALKSSELPTVGGGASPYSNGASDRGASPAIDLSSAGVFALAKEDDSLDAVPRDSASHSAFQSVPDENEEISAADYDPSADRRAEDIRRLQSESTREDVKDQRHATMEGSKLVEPAAEVKVEDLEDADSDDDMFSGVVKAKKDKSSAVPMIARVAPIVPVSAATLSDNWDDSDGYYRLIIGEVLDDGRYHVVSNIGKGMFSAVVKARVVKPTPGELLGKEVAIKIIRSQESMYKAGLKEIAILNKLRDADPDDRKHLVRLERTFEHRGHLCMVFESLSMNLRDVIKRFGKDVGLNIKAVRAYAHQLFLGLSLLQKCKIMHADIKPDNILVTENKSVLKICDLGSASDESENDITPYLVSRFYRAPEIILGLPYDCSLDVWSIGCTLFELYTGKILFPGRSNNQMLLHMMELKGKFNHRLIKKSQFGEMHFDDSMSFISVEVDKITGQNVTKILPTFKARDLRARLLPSASAQAKMRDDELKLLLNFVDLLDKCLHLDSSKRITPKEALTHPFLRG